MGYHSSKNGDASGGISAGEKKGVSDMTHVIPVEQAAAKLSELIHGLSSDEEIVLTENNSPVASLRAHTGNRKRHAGSCKGLLTVVRDDDEHLCDFEEYIA